MLAASSSARSPAAPPTVSAAGSNLLGLSAAGVSRQPGECLVGSGNRAVHVVGSTDGDAGDDVSEPSWVVGVPNVAIDDHLPADEMADVRVSVVKAWSLRSRSPPAAAAERGPHPENRMWRPRRMAPECGFWLSGIPDVRLQSCTAVTERSAVIM